MKTILVKQDKQAQKTGETFKVKSGTVDKIERLLKTLFLISFIALVAAQIALTDPEVRSSFAKEAADGEPIGKEAYLTELCKMELKLIDMDSCPELKVLINGEEADAFYSNTVFLELKDGDVIELDANSMLVSARVQISAVSRNMEYLPGRIVTAADGIVPVAVADTKD